MSKKEKLLERFLLIPSDFTWDELASLLKFFQYHEHVHGKTGGSRRRFIGSDHHIIMLHKPHPGKILKKYAIRQVIDILKQKGIIEDE